MIFFPLHILNAVNIINERMYLRSLDRQEEQAVDNGLLLDD